MMQPRDPFKVYRAFDDRGGGRRGERRFEAGEHLWLGSAGVEAARSLPEHQTVPAELFTHIARQCGHDAFEYGELVALSGDFYETPEALFEEIPAPLPWLWEDNDTSDLRELFAEELRNIEDRHRTRSDPYPVNNIRMAWNAKSFVELALRNEKHFGWHNIMHYCHYHAQALALAREARGRDTEEFRRALVTNAFADHFLTDAFSAGHVRVPRGEIVAWARGRGFTERVAGSLSKLLHDQDGHVNVRSLHGRDEGDASETEGLLVTNAQGVEWRTRCDGQLFLEPGDFRAERIAQPVQAVAASVGELLRAWRDQHTPEIFAATSHAPFPHPDTPSLCAKFPHDLSEPDMSALSGNLPLYARIPWIGGVTVDHVRLLLKDLPSLMGSFRKCVGDQSAACVHVADAYVEAFKKIA